MTMPFSRWTLIRAFVFTVVVFILLAEINRAGGDRNRSEIESEEAHRISEGALNSEAYVTLPNNPADLKFSYKKRKSFRGTAAKRNALVSQRAVYGIVGELKKRIALPFDIQVVFEECGGPDSYYDEDTHEITICYEVIDAYYYLFSRTHKARTARNEAAKGAIVSMFLHEVAHALIDGWDLPITGREEDAADQFSTLLLINSIPDGEQMAMNSARSFKLLADLEKGLKKIYSDPHALDEQRFYSTICLVYGRRPEAYEYLVRNGTLPEERAFECEEDYARLNKSWQTLLAPHLIGRSELSLKSHTLGFSQVSGYSSGIH
jgi:hypothetical protein